VDEALEEARRFILLADAWHAADAIAERVPGEGLRASFDEAAARLAAWRGEYSLWLRRSVGVAAHYYAKRERDDPVRAAQLLDLLAPLLEERNTSAVKGIGWGLKTIGRYHPDLLADWLRCQLADRGPRLLMVRKAVTYLPQGYKSEFLR
jgi:3-methyladenine DNA glycosylase AlkD